MIIVNGPRHAKMACVDNEGTDQPVHSPMLEDTFSLGAAQFDLRPIANSYHVNPCHAEQIKMPRPLQIFGQSDYLIQAVDTNSHT